MSSYFTAQVSISSATATLAVPSDTVDRFVYLTGSNIGATHVAYNSTDVVSQYYVLTTAQAATGFALAAGLDLYVYTPGDPVELAVMATPVPAARLTLGC